MPGLETLDVLIGLITVYLSFGMACTVIVEAVASWLSVRSKNLEAALNEFFAGELKEGRNSSTPSTNIRSYRRSARASRGDPPTFRRKLSCKSSNRWS